MGNPSLLDFENLIRNAMETVADKNEEPIKGKDDFMELVEEGITEFGRQMLLKAKHFMAD